MLDLEARLLKRVERTSAVLLILMPLGAWGLLSAQIAFGVLLGGGIVVISFQVLKWQLRKALLAPGRIPTKGGLFASYYLRFLGTLFVVFTVIHFGWADPIALVVGLSVMVLSIMLVGGMEFLMMSRKKGER